MLWVLCFATVRSKPTQKYKCICICSLLGRTMIYLVIWWCKWSCCRKCAWRKFCNANWCIADFERAGKNFVTCRSESRLPFFYVNCENRQVTLWANEHTYMKSEDMCVAKYSIEKLLTKHTKESIHTRDNDILWHSTFCPCDCLYLYI